MGDRSQASRAGKQAAQKERHTAGGAGDRSGGFRARARTNSSSLATQSRRRRLGPRPGPPRRAGLQFSPLRLRAAGEGGQEGQGGGQGWWFEPPRQAPPQAAPPPPGAGSDGMTAQQRRGGGGALQPAARAARLDQAEPPPPNGRGAGGPADRRPTPALTGGEAQAGQRQRQQECLRAHRCGLRRAPTADPRGNWGGGWVKEGGGGLGGADQVSQRPAGSTMTPSVQRSAPAAAQIASL